MFITHLPDKPAKSGSPAGAVACLTFVILAMIASLFFQKVNAEFFALAGLCLIAAFLLALWSGNAPSANRQLLPLALLFAFWAWLGLATALSPVLFISLGTFWTIAFFPFTALTLVMVADFQKSEVFVVSALMAVVTTLAVYACVHFVIFDEAPRATFANKNNLAALQMPVAFYAAASAVTVRRLSLKVLLLALTALFVFTIGIIGSRAVLICLVTGFVLIVGVLIMDRWPKKSLAALLATVLFALIASNSVGTGNLVKRAETMLAPATAGDTRFIIWEGSLAMAKDVPWHGIGPGLYPMVYSQYRLDEDRSAAFFVHNDYLQFLIEAGWPAALLLLAALIALAIMGIRGAFRKQISRENRLRLLVPLMGAGAIAGHSMLSFNLFLPSLLIMMGILFGLTTHRMQAFALPAGEKSGRRRVARPVFVILVALSLIPGLFFLDTGRGALLHNKGTALGEDQKFQQAIEMLEKAAEISPNADIYHYSLAWLSYRQIAAGGRRPDSQVLEKALQRLDKAEKLNPLRPQIHVIRARILEGLGDPETGENWKTGKNLRDRIEAEYRNALSEDPFYLEARFYLARFLLQQNRLEEGQAILEQGIAKPYTYSELAVNYYRLTAEMRRILGDQPGYKELMDRLRAAVAKHEPGTENPG